MTIYKVGDYNFNFDKFEELTARGLCAGAGSTANGGQVCIEVAIAVACGLPENDNPSCVEPAIRAYKIRLNDSARWSSPETRAAGLHDLGIAQLGSAGVVSGPEFKKLLAEKTIRRLIPALFREIFPNSRRCLDVALRCEEEGSNEAARDAAYAAYAAAASNAASSGAYAAYAASYAAYAAAYAASYAAYAADDAAAAAAAAKKKADTEKYLRLSAELALETLRELGAPGVALLDEIKAAKTGGAL